MLHGTLLKRRDHVPGWRPRHFVLQGAPDHLLLYYLPSPSDSPSNAPHHPPPRGLVPLGGASVRPLSEAEAGGVRHAFRIDHPWAPGVSRSKGWVLAARSRQEREKWVKVLKRGVAEAEEGLRREEEAAAEEQGQQQNEHGGDGVGQEGQEQEEAPAAALAVGEGASVPLEQLVLPGYEEATASAVRTLLEFAEPSDGWRLNFERRGVRAYKREREENGGSGPPRVPNGSFTTLKGQGIIRHHPISVLLAVMDNTIGRDIDPQFDYGRRARIFNQHNFLDYLKYKGIFPVAPRDMYIMCHWRVLEEEDGAIVVASWSDAGAPHPEERGIVRAEVLTAGWVIRPLDPPHCTASSCTYFSMADLKGFIPKAIVDIATDPQPMLIHTVACALDKDTTGRFKVDRHRFTGRQGGGGGANGNGNKGKGTGSTIRRYTTRDVAPYVARIHRHNLADGGRSGHHPWLLDALHQQQHHDGNGAGDGTDGGGGGGFDSYETAEERRRQQQLRQQAFHQEVVARLEREARARSLKEEVQSRAWLSICALGLAFLLLALALALNPSTNITTTDRPPSTPPPPLPLPSPLAARVCDWLGDSWLSRLGITPEGASDKDGSGADDPWRPPEQPPVRPEPGGHGQAQEERARQRRRKKSKGQGMPRGEGPMPPLIA